MIFLKLFTSWAVGGSKPSLSICALALVQVPFPSLFGNVTKNCKLITTKFRRYTQPDRLFI